MADFKGYLLKATKTDKVFPNKYIALESWSSTPNQREEIKAYRDDNTRALTRVTASGKKSKWEFTTRPNLHLADKKAILKFFTDGESNHEERKISLEFWDEENNKYKTGVFYRPNMDFKIRRITNDDIIYDEMTIKGIEY